MLDISTFFANILPGKKQPSERDGRLNGKADVAQVVTGEELGFSVTGVGADDVNRRDPLMRGEIASQLGSLSELYRQQNQSNPSLMGRVTLRLTVTQAGQVIKVESLNSDFSDSEFKKSIAAEAHKWQFPEASMGDVTVEFPLLFIPPGIDVTSIIKWEQSIAVRAAEPSVVAMADSSKQDMGPTQESSTVKSSTSSGPGKTEAKRSASSKKGQGPGSYETLRPTAVYREPREDSEQVATIEAGIKVNVVAVQGEWLEIRSRVGNPPGFIKKDSATRMAGQ